MRYREILTYGPFCWRLDRPESAVIPMLSIRGVYTSAFGLAL